MKFLFQFLSIMVISYILEIFFPWYAIAIAAFLMGYMLKSNANFLAGFLSIALLWLLKAWLINSSSDSDLANRVGQIFGLNHSGLLFLLMAVIGGLVGGFAALTGSLLKRKKDVTYYNA